MIKLKELREEKDVYQGVIAKALGVKTNTYSKWEREENDFSLEICFKLAAYYNVSFDYLLGISNIKNKVNDKFKFDQKVLSSRLKSLRNENKLNQTKLSSKLGFPQTTYSNYETGNREITTLKLLLIAMYYNVSFDYLIGRTDTK